MSKKKLILNESVTRRFMKLATIEPTYVSSFLNEAEEEEMDMAGDDQEELAPEEPPADMDAEPMDAEPMEDEPADESAAAESLVMDLLAKIQEFAEEKGVSMELEGDEPEGDMEDEGMEEMEADDAAPGGGDDLGEPAGAEDMGDMEDEGEGYRPGAMEEDLDLSGITLVDNDEDAIIAETLRRVAKRLLNQSAK